MSANRQQGSSTVRIVALLALAALVVAGTSMWIEREPEPLLIDERADLEVRLVEMCQKHIRSRLKAPSEGKFMPETNVEETAGHPGFWKVTGKVDAINSFGAVGRSTYYCDVMERSEGMPLIVLSGLDD